MSLLTKIYTKNKHIIARAFAMKTAFIVGIFIKNELIRSRSTTRLIAKKAGILFFKYYFETILSKKIKANRNFIPFPVHDNGNK